MPAVLGQIHAGMTAAGGHVERAPPGAAGHVLERRGHVGRVGQNMAPAVARTLPIELLLSALLNAIEFRHVRSGFYFLCGAFAAWCAAAVLGVAGKRSSVKVAT